MEWAFLVAELFHMPRHGGVRLGDQAYHQGHWFHAHGSPGAGTWPSHALHPSPPRHTRSHLLGGTSPLWSHPTCLSAERSLHTRRWSAEQGPGYRAPLPPACGTMPVTPSSPTEGPGPGRISQMKELKPDEGCDLAGPRVPDRPSSWPSCLAHVTARLNLGITSWPITYLHLWHRSWGAQGTAGTSWSIWRAWIVTGPAASADRIQPLLQRPLYQEDSRPELAPWLAQAGGLTRHHAAVRESWPGSRGGVRPGRARHE